MTPARCAGLALWLASSGLAACAAEDPGDARPPAASSAGSSLARALPLQLVNEKKFDELFAGDPLDHYEASGIAAAGGRLYVVFDDSTAITSLDTSLDEAVFGAGETISSQYEAISATDDGRFIVMIETTSDTDLRAQLVQLDGHTAIVDQAFIDTAFLRANRGFEGAAWLRLAGTEWVLALCENNECADDDSPSGRGRVHVLARQGQTWVTRRILELPEDVGFASYSDLALRSNGDGSYTAAVLSRKSSAVWLGTLLTEPWSFAASGTFYTFPRDDGDVSYCALEGVTFLGPRLMGFVSDSGDGGKPCEKEDESIHVFELPL